MHSYTLPDLQNRYGMRKSALHKFLARHLGKLTIMVSMRSKRKIGGFLMILLFLYSTGFAT